MASSSMTQEYLDTIAASFEELGSYELVAQKTGTTRETIRRYMREYRRRAEPSDAVDEKKETLLHEIASKYSVGELKALARGHTIQTPFDKPIHNFTGEEIKIGVMSDLHLGSKYTNPEDVFRAYDEFEKQGVKFITCGGDVTEGLSNRAGHMYECSHIGYAEQKAHAVEVLGQAPAAIYAIAGNHDLWYLKSAGAHIVNDIASQVEDMHFLGDHEGDIWLNDSGTATLKLWHGDDGSAYAISYRGQKVIESLTGGEKPSILFAAHSHKHIAMWNRHVYYVESGSIQRQSKWMRSKRLAAHSGFAIVTVIVNANGIGRASTEWFPFYV